MQSRDDVCNERVEGSSSGIVITAEEKEEKLLQQLGFDKNTIQSKDDDIVSSDEDEEDQQRRSSTQSRPPFDARVPHSNNTHGSTTATANSKGKYSVQTPIAPPPPPLSSGQRNTMSTTALSSYASSPSTTASLARSLGGIDNVFGSNHSGSSSNNTVSIDQYHQLQESLHNLENERKQLETRLESITTFSKSQMGLLRKAMIKQLRDKDTVMDDILKRITNNTVQVTEISSLIQKSRSATETAEKSTEKITASLSLSVYSSSNNKDNNTLPDVSVGSGTTASVSMEDTPNTSNNNNDTINQLQISLAQSEAQINMLQKESKEYKDKLFRIIAEKDESDNQQEKLRITVGQLENQIVTLESTKPLTVDANSNSSDKEIIQLRKEWDEMKNSYESQLAEHVMYRQQIDQKLREKEAKITELDKRILAINLTQKTNNQSELAEKEKVITDLRTKVSDQEGELSTLRTENSTLQKSLLTIQENLRTDTVNMKLQYDRDMQQLKDTLSTENSSSLTRISTLEEERTLMQTREQQYEETVNKLTAELADLRTSLETAKTTAKAREDKIKTTAKSQFEDLKTRFVGELEGKTKELTDLTNRYETVRQEYTLQNQQYQTQIYNLQNEIQHLKRLSTSSLWSVLVEQIKVLKNQQLILKNQVKDNQAQLTQYMKESMYMVQEKCNLYNEVFNNLVIRYKKEFIERKRIFNELQELRGNIRVYCRVRPVLPFEEEKGSPVCTKFPAEGEITVINNKKQVKTWEFDQVFAPQATNETVFREVEGLITSAMDGYHVCIFAYGQTGSGKTFTMEGSSSSPGINYRTIDSIFNCVNERTEAKYEIAISMLEIYNETLKDMLLFTNSTVNRSESSSNSGKNSNNNTSNDTASKLIIRSNNNGTYVPDLTIVTVKTREQVLELLRNGYSNRATFATNMNEHSSRSHCIFTLYVTGTNTLTNTVTKGRLHLIDLAGSERISKSGAVGDRLKEAQAINTSLSALGDVIQARGEKRNHIPFRNSTLTLFLSESLSGDSKTLMFVNLSPILSNSEETFCSLNFAARARAVELGKAAKHTGKASSTPVNNGEVDETYEE